MVLVHRLRQDAAAVHTNGIRRCRGRKNSERGCAHSWRRALFRLAVFRTPSAQTLAMLIATLAAGGRSANCLKMRLNLDDCVRSLCSAHSWISLEESRVLLLDAYRRFRGQAKYGGNSVQTLLGIESSILQRASEQELKQRLAVAREWF